MDRECGCLGGNANCTFCFGSGYIADSYRLSLSYERRTRPISAQTSAREITKPSHVPPFGCSYCTDRFNSAERMESHVDSEHVASASDDSTNEKGKPLVRVGNRVFDRRILEQARKQVVDEPLQLQTPGGSGKAHDALPMVNTTSARSKSTKASGSNPVPRRKHRLVDCPDCPSLVREDRLDRHREKQHRVVGEDLNVAASTKRILSNRIKKPHPRTLKIGRKLSIGGTARSGAVALNKGTIRPAQKSSNDDNELNSIDNYWEERRLDGSRDYWQTREDGRFGSHPSFDDCDDESAP
jgi:hypothetical protein